MKRVILSLVLALTLGMNAQEKYKSYKHGAIDVVVKEGRSQGKAYVDINEIGLILNETERVDFVEFLKESYLKYEEWSRVAVENNVVELRKDIKNISFDGYFYYGGWKFGTANMKTLISIDGENSRIYLYVSKMVASSNQFMKSDSEIMELTPIVIEELEKGLDNEAIADFVASKNNTENLFE